MLAASVMFSMTGVNKQRFIEQVKADPQTYRDWAGNAEWDIEISGKENELFSPFCASRSSGPPKRGSSRRT